MGYSQIISLLTYQDIVSREKLWITKEYPLGNRETDF